jgi:hypothetical protein
VDIAPREVSVFVNCPFDDDYRSLRDTLVFTIICCGFVPRSSMEPGPTSERIRRIHALIEDCKYSIHDLSRCRGEGELNFARFNMPLELGMAMGHAKVGQKHEWLALALSDTESGRYVSDLLGFDLARYDGTAAELVSKVMSFLLAKEEAAGDLTPIDVVQALPLFEDQVREARVAWFGDTHWPTLLRVAEQCVPAAAPAVDDSVGWSR